MYDAGTRSCDEVGVYEEVILIHLGMPLWEEALTKSAYHPIQVIAVDPTLRLPAYYTNLHLRLYEGHLQRDHTLCKVMDRRHRRLPAYRYCGNLH